jgi:hypothetical protein
MEIILLSISAGWRKGIPTFEAGFRLQTAVPVGRPMQGIGFVFERQKPRVTLFATKWSSKKHGQKRFLQQSFPSRLMDSMAGTTRAFDRRALQKRPVHLHAARHKTALSLLA